MSQFESLVQTRSECTHFDSPLLLSDIIQHSRLPQRLLFTESVYGVCKVSDFVDGDMIDIHFCKETVFANVQRKSGNIYRVPINAKFSMDILEDTEVKAQAGTMSSSQFMKMTILPRIVTVTGGTKSTEFSKHEVLVVQQRKPAIGGVECYSLQTKTRKNISKSSAVQLKVVPLHLNLCFADVIEHIHLPLVGRLLPSEKRQTHFFKEGCKILSLEKQSSVVASLYKNHKSVSELIEKREVLEILSTIELNFQQVKLTDEENELLIRRSRALYDAFTPACIKKVIENLEPTDSSSNEFVHESGERMMNGVSLVPIIIAHPKPKPPLVKQEQAAHVPNSTDLTIQQQAYAVDANHYESIQVDTHEYESIHDVLKQNLPVVNRVPERLQDKLTHKGKQLVGIASRFIELTDLSVICTLQNLIAS